MKQINKSLATHQDLAIGVGDVIQQRANQSLTVRQIELTWIFRSVAEIRDLDINKYTRVQLHQPGETIEYWYDANSVVPDDGTNSLQPVSLPPTGRWIKVVRSGSGGGSVDGDYFPLEGNTQLTPITGQMIFRGAGTAATVDIEHQDGFFGGDALVFKSNANNTSFIFEAKTPAGVAQGFAFSSEGNFVLPSTDENNTDQWTIGAATVLGVANTLVFAATDSLGDQIANNIAFSTDNSVTFVANQAGYFELPRATQSGDPNNAAASKGYVDGLIPPGGGEANTMSSAGAGLSIVLPKSGADLPVKSIVAGTNITITEGADTLTINSSGAGGGDFIPLAGTSGTSGVSGNVEFNDNNGLEFGGRFGLAYSVPNSALLIVPPSSGTAAGFTVGVWDGSVQRNIALKANGQIEAGTATVNSAVDASVVTVGHLNTTVGNYARLAAANNTFTGTMDIQGQVNFGDKVIAFDQGSFGSLITNIGSIQSATQVTAASASPTQANHLTRKDYVDTQIATRVPTTRTISTTNGITGGGSLAANRTLQLDGTVVRTTGTQSIGGAKTFTATINSDSGIKFINGFKSFDVFATDFGSTNVLNISSSTNNSTVALNARSSGGTQYTLSVGADGNLYFRGNIIANGSGSV